MKNFFLTLAFLSLIVSHVEACWKFERDSRSGSDKGSGSTDKGNDKGGGSTDKGNDKGNGGKDKK